MNGSSKKHAWVVGLASAVPVLLYSTPAWAEPSGVGVVASVASAVAGCALGSLVAGGVGYSALNRQQHRYEEFIASMNAPAATKEPQQKRAQAMASEPIEAHQLQVEEKTQNPPFESEGAVQPGVEALPGSVAQTIPALPEMAAQEAEVLNVETPTHDVPEAQAAAAQASSPSGETIEAFEIELPEIEESNAKVAADEVLLEDLLALLELNEQAAGGEVETPSVTSSVQPSEAPLSLAQQGAEGSRWQAMAKKIPPINAGYEFEAVTAEPLSSSAPPQAQEQPALPSQELVEAPAAYSTTPPSPKSKAKVSSTDDYGQIAEEYVARRGLKDRVKSRAKNVADVLNERMGTALLDGLPVITRADGSVGDLGNSWWAKLPQVSERRSISVPEVPPAPQQPPYFEQSPYPQQEAYLEQEAYVQQEAYPQQPSYEFSAQQAAYPPQQSAFGNDGYGNDGFGANVPSPAYYESPSLRQEATPSSSTRAQLIAQRVNSIEQEAYPEIESDQPTTGDGWEQALAAMDSHGEDNLMRPRPLPRVEQGVQPVRFGDVVGSAETLDEPDGLERDTRFLMFRAPGNHPEVQDTGSYIDYLINDEFGRNRSSHARAHARSFLRVHEGGHTRQARAM